MTKLTITKYQAWRFSTEPYSNPWTQGKGEFEKFEPRYPLAPAWDTFEEALADLVRCHEGSRNNGGGRNRFDIVVPNPESQFASGDLARKW